MYLIRSNLNFEVRLFKHEIKFSNTFLIPHELNSIG